MGCVHGKKWIGFVRGYTDANNDENGKNITLKIDGIYNGFYHENIASIKEIAKDEVEK